MTTVFIRAIEPAVDEKPSLLLAAVRGKHPARFDAEVSTFKQVPRSPFAYWVRDELRRTFTELRAFESGGRKARRGLGTNDDFRFLRLWLEVAPNPDAWAGHAKGGPYSPFYSPLALSVNWKMEGAELKAFFLGKGESPSRNIRSESDYRRPGLTWSLRTQADISFRLLPKNCIIGSKGPAVFVDGDGSSELLAIAALANSSIFRVLISMQMTFGSYEVGVIQTTPMPTASEAQALELSRLGLRCWTLKRRLDTRTETSHAFLLPALLQVGGNTLIDRAEGWGQKAAAANVELVALADEIDDHAYKLYGISAEDRQRIEQGIVTSDEESADGAESDNDDDDADGEAGDIDAGPMVASLLSWSVGVGFGRFDIRLATREREAPEPEPFDPLPLCSPGMLMRDDGLPADAPPSGYPLSFATDGILVDDPGHPRDLVHAVRSVFETVFDDANARWHEAAELLGTPDLRTWFARDFFEPHIKRYSKSRRKAPIYWQLSTASGSYSVWLYIHRGTGDTLFRVLNDFVGPKLDHEKTKLDGLTQEAGANPSAAQRRELEQQETFVGELQALKAEVARVAPLWKPNLDDGVILNFAPLWRLVPQSRSWQGECKKAWDKLVAGDYDWAHLAMHLWPERVVPKCQDDRSLAIAHGLEDVFWHEDDSGTWRKSRVDDATEQKLIQERTSTTVKAALKDLLSAAAPTPSKGRKAKGRSASPRTSAPKPAPAAARATTPDTALDEATLRAVKAAIASVADGASKADVLTATGLTDGDWNKAIAALLDRGDVTRTGQRRGTRYHATGPGSGP